MTRSWCLVFGLRRPTITTNDALGAHWRTLQDPKRQAKLLTRNAVTASGMPKGVPRCSISTTWHPPDDGRRDADSLTVFGKYAVDEVVRLGHLADDSRREVLSHLYSVAGTDRVNPRIEMRITEEEGAA